MRNEVLTHDSSITACYSIGGEVVIVRILCKARGLSR
jgi:hypothetical protein